jgi:hypothetical protein
MQLQCSTPDCEAAVGLVSCVLLVWVESAYFGLSPLAVMFVSPRPGAPSLWLGIVLVDYLTAGDLPGDFADLLGILLFGVPLALVIGGLNARAFLLELREFCDECV